MHKKFKQTKASETDTPADNELGLRSAEETEGATQHSKKSLLRNNKFRWPHFVIFALVVGLIGSYLLFFASASPQVITLDGRLQLLTASTSEDSQNDSHHDSHHTHSDLYQLLTSDNQLIPLEFKEAPNIQPGSHIKVKGSKASTTVGWGTGSALAADSSSSSVAVDSTTVVQANTPPPILGPQKAAAIRINFSNASYTTPSATDVDTIFFSGAKSANAYMKQNSFGKASLEGSKVFTVNISNKNTETITGSSLGCAYDNWANAAKSALQAQGVDASSYSYFIFLLPKSSACNFDGLGYVGGDLHYSWINGPTLVSVYSIAHEVGHNFGLNHSDGLTCSQKGKKVQMSATCGTTMCHPRPGASVLCGAEEYADQFDPTGSITIGSTPPHYSVVHKEQLGWLYKSNVLDITQSGTYKIYRTEVATTGPMAIRFPRLGTNQYYYLETRRGVGFDANFRNAALYPSNEVIRGITIRLAINDNNDTYVLNADPGQGSWYKVPITAAASGATDTFTDSASGLTIKYVGKTDLYTTVKVTFTKPPVGSGDIAPPSTLSVAPENAGALAPLALFYSTDCGQGHYITATDNSDTLSPDAYTYLGNIGKAYNSSFPGTVPLYDNLTYVKSNWLKNCVFEDHFYSTNAAQTKPLFFTTTLVYERQDPVAWVFPSQVGSSVPLYNWTCQDGAQTGNGVYSPFQRWSLDPNYIYTQYSRADLCTRSVLGYVLP